MKILVLILSIMSAACAIGPIALHETARSLGESKHDLIFAYGTPGYIVKWNHGLTENLDLGFQVETLSLGAKLKYSFINNQTDGFSFAGVLGIGENFGGEHQYADLIISNLSGGFEPYGAIRYVHAKSDTSDWKNSETGEVVLTVNSFNFNYAQAIAGFKYWPSERVSLSVEGTKFIDVSSQTKFVDGTLWSAGIGFKY